MDRRNFLLSGFAGIALGELLRQDQALATDQVLHHPPKVKRVV
jgi:hypothetical protein